MQYLDQNGERAVAVVNDGVARKVNGYTSVYAIATASLSGKGIGNTIREAGLSENINYLQLLDDGRLLSPIDHPDPSHLYLTGTGLTHLGSASTRDAMHKSGVEQDEVLTDSMKMFQMGLEQGKPVTGTRGVQPEWFYKGNGHCLAAPCSELRSPAFALDAGEEPEIAGIYIIDADGNPCRLGFTLANEFSDHITERANYLYLAHSKLRPCSIGPELRLGALPAHIEGTSRILREGKVFWEKPFLSGEDNMSHSIANLEYHHFKYGLFRQPGDVHVHMFGTATLSVADGIVTKVGDIFEIEAQGFGLPLRNTIGFDPDYSMPVIDIA
nr:AraD1 family protein [Brucella gallinifaecis]